MGIALPSSHQLGLKILKGIAAFSLLRPDGSYHAQQNLSPAATFSFSVEPQISKYISEESGVGEVLQSDITQMVRTGELTLNRLTLAMMGFFFLADLATLSQAGGTVTDERTGYVAADCSIQLGASNINGGAGVFGVSAVTVKAYEGENADARANSTAYVKGDFYVPASPNGHWYVCTEPGTSAGSAPTFTTDGTEFADGGATFLDLGLIAYTVADDYEVDATYGRLNVLRTGAIATAANALFGVIGDTFTLEVDYTVAAKSIESIAAEQLKTLVGALHFYSETPKGDSAAVYYMPKVTLSPSGAFSLKTGTEYGSLTFKVEIEKPVTGPSFRVHQVPA